MRTNIIFDEKTEKKIAYIQKEAYRMYGLSMTKSEAVRYAITMAWTQLQPINEDLINSNISQDIK